VLPVRGGLLFMPAGKIRRNLLSREGQSNGRAKLAWARPDSLPTQRVGRRSLSGWPLHTYAVLVSSTSVPGSRFQAVAVDDHRAFGPADPGGEAGGPADALHGVVNPGAAGRRGCGRRCTRPPVAGSTVEHRQCGLFQVGCPATVQVTFGQRTGDHVCAR
jgi:hypothetical protein